jgi:hypothetical protein
VGPRVGVDNVEKRKFLTLPGDSKLRPLGRPARSCSDCAIPARRRGWEDSIKMDHREIGWEDVDWIYEYL